MMDPRNDVSLFAYFDNRFEIIEEAVNSYLEFARSLEGQIHFNGNWVYARTDLEAENNQGFNPVTEPQVYLDYLRAQDEQNKEEVGNYGELDDYFSLTLPHTSPPLREERYNYRDSFHYRGGTAGTNSDQLTYGNDIRRSPAFFDLASWTRLTELIVAWRVPRYIWFDSYLYEIEGRIYKHRAWGGWLGWFPHQINIKDLPLGALAIQVGPGTLVASQQAQLQSEIPEQLEQAQKVEMALVELGVLPAQADLISPSPPSGKLRD